MNSKKTDDMDLADLCAPLSAKVLPRSALLNTTGQIVKTEAMALRYQRTGRKCRTGDRTKPERTKKA
ncbi:hypothetical protein [uncultured Tateyamaria sp.]|uniref:hypothetical protein n=1 Tax=uncultured Tateyamaria sp. TaxID=455651 RepID=UPI00260DF438|nr:hypothetical protein [uncultured Tateyamaria sp.]